MKLAVRKTSTAIAAVATAGVSTLFIGVAPASAAPGDACGAGTLIALGVCEQTFTSGSATFTPTAAMTKLEVLLVGAGGAGADQTAPNTNGYAAAGGGGQVKIVDFSGATAPLNLTVATSGVPGAVTDGTTSAAVANGTNGSGATGGSSGSGFAGASGFNTLPPYGAGGGAAASPANNANGGAGVVVSSIAPVGSLFSGDTNCYGGGGAIGVSGVQGIPGCGAGGPTDSSGTSLTAPVANSGGGGGGLKITQPLGLRAGASGVVVIRWSGATATLTFAANGHGTAPTPQTVIAGTAAVQPADPTASGYVFNGWYSDAALTTPADFSVPLTGATTYYASWVPATVTLAFAMNGHGTAPTPQTVIVGTAPVQPADPTASGYVFNGWYSDAALTTPADFSVPLTGPTTYYASWVPATATLTFAMKGHGTATPQTVIVGTAPVKPTDPTATGYVFKGWYSDAALTTPADFSVPLTGPTTYYASWALALAATGGAPSPAELPIGLAAVIVGTGLFAAANNRKRKAN